MFPAFQKLLSKILLEIPLAYANILCKSFHKNLISTASETRDRQVVSSTLKKMSST